MDETEKTTTLLKEIQGDQKQLLELQAESLKLQRRQMQLAKQLLDKPNGAAGQGHRYQKRGTAMMDKTSNLFLIIIFLLVLLLFYVSWVLFV